VLISETFSQNTSEKRVLCLPVRLSVSNNSFPIERIFTKYFNFFTRVFEINLSKGKWKILLFGGGVGVSGGFSGKLQSELRKKSQHKFIYIYTFFSRRCTVLGDSCSKYISAREANVTLEDLHAKIKVESDRRLDLRNA